MCTDGQVKSLILMILVPFISIVLSICLCCVTADNGLDEENPCCSMLRPEKARKYNRKVVAQKGFNRKNSTKKQRRRRSKAPKVVSRHSERALHENDHEGGNIDTERGLMKAMTVEERKARVEIEMEDIKRQQTHQRAAQGKPPLDIVDEEMGRPQ